MNWFTAFALNTCVSFACPSASGWMLTALKVGLMGSVNVGCVPWSVRYRRKSLSLFPRFWSTRAESNHSLLLLPAVERNVSAHGTPAPRPVKSPQPVGSAGEVVAFTGVAVLIPGALL